MQSRGGGKESKQEWGGVFLFSYCFVFFISFPPVYVPPKVMEGTTPMSTCLHLPVCFFLLSPFALQKESLLCLGLSFSNPVQFAIHD